MLRIMLLFALFASLLTFTPIHAAAVNCYDAPAPRLRVGMTAVIAPGVDRLNLRSFPAVSTGIEAQLYSGTEVIVVAGPSCNGHYQWWRVELPGGRRGWVAEGTWEQWYVVPAAQADNPVTPLEWTCPPFSTRECFVVD